MSSWGSTSRPRLPAAACVAFSVGDPELQRIDVIAGSTIDRVAAAEQQGGCRRGHHRPTDGRALVSPHTRIQAWRTDESGRRFAVIDAVDPATVEQIAARPPIVTSALLTGLNLDAALVRPWLLEPVYRRLFSGESRLSGRVAPGSGPFSAL